MKDLDLHPRVRSRTLVLVGLMGAGKTSVGRKLAGALDMRFIDADAEIEAAAGCSISEIFERHGEAEFRRGERQVIARLLAGPPHVLSAGGGAFMDPATRELIAQKAVSIWLRADLDVLMKRLKKRDTRPLLKDGDPRHIMSQLMAQRYPVYEQADIIVDSVDGPHDAVVRRIVEALCDHYAKLTP